MRKTIFTLGLMLAAALSLTNCTKNEEANFTPEVQVPFEFYANMDDTRTTNKGIKTEWVAGDAINVFHAEATTDTYVSDGSFTTEDESGLFKGALTAELTAATYDWYAFYPYSSYIKTPANTSAGYMPVGCKSNQTQTQSGNDNMSHIAGGDYPLYGVAKSVAASEKPQITMKHLTSLLAFDVYDQTGEGFVVESIAFTAPEDIVGTYYINFAAEPVVYTGSGDNYVSSTATLTVEDGEEVTGDGAMFYMGIKPFTAKINSTLTVKITTDKGTFEKSITLTKDTTFAAGKFKTLTVNVDELEGNDPSGLTSTISFATTDQRESQTTTAQVWTNGEITFTNEKAKATSNVVGNSNPVRIYKNSNIIIASSVGKITKIEFNSEKDYSDSPYLTQLKTSLSSLNPTVDGQKVTVVLSEPTDEITIAMSAGQARLYSLTVTYTPADASAPIIGLEKTSLNVDAAATSEEVAVTIKNINESDVNITCDVDWVKAALANGVLTLNIDENTTTEVRNASITLSANGATATVTVEQKGKPVAAQLITVAEFLAKEESEDVEYILSGTITSVANTTYGNFDLTDDTGTVYIYGLVSPDGATNKYWATSGAKIGDDIVVKTIRTSFNNTPQGKNAKFVELVSPGTRAFYTVDPMAVDFASAGGSRNVNVTTYNTNATVSATSDNDVFTVSVSGKVVTISAVANEPEEEIEGVVTINVGNLAPTEVKVTLAAKPAAGAVEGGSDDFHTISSTNISYTSGKTTAGWAYTNCAIFKGGTSDSSPAFNMIGDASNRALCMNGKTSAAGTITSPTLTTGCGTLKFNYGLPFSDTKIKFSVEIMQNGAVVKNFTVQNLSATMLTKYSFEETVNVTGDFQIVFKNLFPSSSTSNKDRTAIWDVEWTGYNN